jgi:hypothetical protein
MIASWGGQLVIVQGALVNENHIHLHIQIYYYYVYSYIVIVYKI